MLPVQELVASFLLGTALNLALFGITWGQYVEYYRTSKDNWIYRLAAAFVFVVGTVHTCFAFHASWVYSVDSLVNPNLYTASPWSFSADPLLTSVVAAVVQLSYAHRIWIVSKRSPWAAGLLVVLTAVSFAFGIVNTAFASACPAWTCVNTKTWSVGTWLGALTASDLLITGSLTFYLRRTRSDFQETNTLLDRIIRLTVQNNGLTAAAAVASAVLFAFSLIWHLVPGLVLVKLYQVSFFSALNARHRIASDLCTTRGSPQFRGGANKGTLPFSTSGGSTSMDDAQFPAMSSTGKRSQYSARPGFLRSLSANSVRSLRDLRQEGDSLPVQVVVESTTVEDRHSDDAWDAEKLMDTSRLPSSSSTSEASETPFSLAPGGTDLRIAPFLAVPPQSHR